MTLGIFQVYFTKVLLESFWYFELEQRFLKAVKRSYFF